MKRRRKTFQLVSEFRPRGDQPKAIRELVEGFQTHPRQVLLGVTGSGKTFTMAHVIAQLGLPTLVLAHNKTLAAQLYQEFKQLFPYNAVEYFVSYFDYYQPEAYLPHTDTYIEKESSINEQIDRMRHAATQALLERTDVIIVASVSCIYGIGSPEAYANLLIHLNTGDILTRDEFLRRLVEIQYQRAQSEFQQGQFRVRGNVVDVFPVNTQEHAYRVVFQGGQIQKLYKLDPVTGLILHEVSVLNIYPATHYVSSADRLKVAIKEIRKELQERLQFFRSQGRLLEAQRLENRVLQDLEMLESMGYCSGIENYSRYLTGRLPGQPPPTLIEYFPKEFLCIIDESHVTIGQLQGMYRGDYSRKLTLVEYGFRLPSALDNRPLKFEEFDALLSKVIYVSATPGDHEITASRGRVVEMINRPTGLLDPQVEVRPTQGQLEDLLIQIRQTLSQGDRVLVATLTVKMAEEVTRFLQNHRLRAKHIHADVDTIERVELIRQLRLGEIDVLVGVNLLREGLDMPEVALVAILDADKEGFLRSYRSLIQMIGRAARNLKGRAILYADEITPSIQKTLEETQRRRRIQEEFNKAHGIQPQAIRKAMAKGLLEVFEGKPLETDPVESWLWEGQIPQNVLKDLSLDRILARIHQLRLEMQNFVKNLEFEKAAKIRDEIRRWQQLELWVRESQWEAHRDISGQ